MKHFGSIPSVQSFALFEAKGLYAEIQKGLHWHWMALKMLDVDPKVSEGSGIL
jgi:hypothetical protein